MNKNDCLICESEYVLTSKKLCEVHTLNFLCGDRFYLENNICKLCSEHCRLCIGDYQN